MRMGKSIALLIVLVFLAASCTIVAKPVKAQYQGDITISADGSVSPSTAPIERFGASYILTSNVVGNIAVDTNNIVFDGNGHVISGFRMYSVKNETIRNFIISGDNVGIALGDASNVTITNNTITGTSALPFMPTGGIAVIRGSFNIISGNNFVNNKVGINLAECSHNVIVGNNFTGCSIALLLYDSASNTIYHNNFIKNAVILEDDGYSGYSIVSVNIWDDGHGLGNYWSDYLTRYPKATEIDTAGIGDTPYFVKPANYIDSSNTHFGSAEARDYWSRLNALYANNTDRYPLMEPFTTTPPKISVLSPLNQTYNETSVPLVFTVDKTVNWTGYSLDGEPNVTVTSSSLLTNVTIANVTSGVHNVTVYANDTYGNMGASPTVTFTIAKPEPFPTALVATASGLSVAVVGVVLLFYFKKRKH
jgi:parallel beta-helix repeat protein